MVTNEEGVMEYIHLSFNAEMEHLEHIVAEELETVQHSLKEKLARSIVHEAEQGLSWFKTQIKQLQQVSETRIKNIDEEVSNLREELNRMNDENRHLHEMVVFFGKQLNKRMSASTASTSDESSVCLDELMRGIDGKMVNDKDQLLESVQNRACFLERHCAEQSRTIQQLIEAKSMVRLNGTSSLQSSFNLPFRSSLTDEGTTINSSALSGRDHGHMLEADISGNFMWEKHILDGDKDIEQEEHQGQQPLPKQHLEQPKQPQLEQQQQ